MDQIINEENLYEIYFFLNFFLHFIFQNMSLSDYSSSSSDTDDSDFDQSTKSIVKKPRVSEGFGEGNLKGFASAFNTIMSRPAEVIQEDREMVEEAAGITDSSVVDKKEKPVMAAHISEPQLSTECEKEISLEAIARRGVVKLFRAVAMHRRRQIEHEKGLGIGVDKSGRRRRLVRRGAAPIEDKPAPAAAGSGMSSFLEALKSHKTKRATIASE